MCYIVQAVPRGSLGRNVIGNVAAAVHAVTEHLEFAFVIRAGMEDDVTKVCNFF